MARSAKDLRDIINISRLSMHPDAESSDEFSSDDLLIPSNGHDDELATYLMERPGTAMSESNFATVPAQTRPGSARKRLESSSSKDVQFRPMTAPQQSSKHTKIKSKVKSGRNTVPFQNGTKILNKYTPVPPIVAAANNNNNYTKNKMKTIKSQKTETAQNFDYLFEYLDSTIVNSWLEELNEKLAYMNTTMKNENHFLEFSNFFLTMLPLDKYNELIDLEFSIIIDQLKYAFHAGFNENVIKLKDLYCLLQSVLKEYPKKLKRTKKGPKLLLSLVLVFCSEKDDTYRKLLRNINCTSDNKLYIQWLLAIRAFGLISFIVGILNFYENIKEMQGVLKSKKTGESNSHSSNNVLNLEKLAIDAVKLNYIEVLDFLHTNTDTTLINIQDQKKRNLFFIAVAERDIDIMKYLVKIGLNINHKSENGSCPLLYAVNKNDHEIAEVLLNLKVDVNVWNEQCEGATPLHSAVMLGDLQMVQLLVCHGADATACMGLPATITPLSIAQQMQHDEIVALLTS